MLQKIIIFLLLAATLLFSGRAFAAYNGSGPGHGQIITAWNTPDVNQSYTIVDPIIVSGNWQLDPNETANIKIFVDGALVQTVAVKSDAVTTTGTFSNTISAGTYALDSHTIWLQVEWMSICGDINCPGGVQMYFARDFKVTPVPDPYLSFTPAPDAPPAASNYEFGFNNVLRDMTITIENIGGGTAVGQVSDDDHPSYFSCVSVTDNTSHVVSFECNYSLDAGKTAAVILRFDPKGDAVSHSATFTFPRGDGLSAQTVTAHGTVTKQAGPFIRVRTTNLNQNTGVNESVQVDEGAAAINVAFPSRLVSTNTGQNSRQYFDNYPTIYNIGTDSLSGQVSGVAPPFSCSASWDCHYNNILPLGKLEPGFIRFDPTAGGIFNQAWKFKDSTTDKEATVNVTAVGIDYPILSTVLTLFNFGIVPIDSSATVNFSVVNDGMGLMTVKAVLTGPFSGPNGCTDGNTQSDCAFSLNEKGEKLFSITYTPSASGSQDGSVQWNTDAQALGTFGKNIPCLDCSPVRNLSGTGNELSVSGPSGFSPQPDGVFPIYNYGDVVVDDKKTADFTLTNVGASPVNGAVTFANADPFYCDQIMINGVLNAHGDCNYTIPSSETMTASIRFTPPTVGDHTTTLSFTGGAASQDVTLRGKGVLSDISVTPALFDYPATAIGANVAEIFRITNSGTGGTISGTLSFNDPITGSPLVGGPFSCDASGVSGAGEHLVDDFSPSLSWTTGRFGRALDFGARGTGDLHSFVSLPSDVDVSGDFTFAAWVRRDRMPGGDTLVAQGTSAGKDRLVLDHNVYDRTALFYDKADGTGKETDVTYTPAAEVPGAWHFEVGEWDGTNAKVSLDGAPFQSLSTAIPANSTAPFYIGRSNGATYADAARNPIDEVWIYDRALTEAEVYDMYTTNIGPASGIVGHWNFDEGAGVTVNDVSGNGNNGAFDRDIGWRLFNSSASLSGGALRMTIKNDATSPKIIKSVTPFSGSYNRLRFQYKNTIKGPDQLRVRYKDTADCNLDESPTCEQTFNIKNADNAWHTLDAPITDPEWIDYDGDIKFLSFLFQNGQVNNTIEIDSILFVQSVASDCSFGPLSAGQTQDIPIKFEPTVTGYFSANAVFNAGGSLTKTVPLTGVGTDGKNISVTPGAANFGVVDITTNVSKNFTVTNTGNILLSGELSDPSDVALQGGGMGLLATYYNGSNFESAVGTRTEGPINFVWGQGTNPMSPQIDSALYSVRWRGKIEPLTTGLYTFSTGNGGVNTNGGVRLFINGERVIDQWNNGNDNIERTGTFYLEKGYKYDVVVEFYNDGGDSEVKLYWQGPGVLKQIVPKTQLYTYEQLATAPPAESAGDPFNTSASPFSCVTAPDDCAYTVAPGESKTITVSFNPSAEGDSWKNAYFTGGGGMVVPLFGIGNADPTMGIEWWDAGAGAWGAPPGTVDFGSVNIGTNSTQKFRVSNTGAGTLEGSIIVNAPFYCETPGACSFTVANSNAISPDSSREFIFKYSPGVNDEGVKTMTARFVNTTMGPPDTLVDFRGNGIFVPTITLDTYSFDFGQVPVGTTATREIVFQNQGTEAFNGNVSIAAGHPEFSCADIDGDAACLYDINGKNTSYAGSIPPYCVADGGPYSCVTATFTFTPATSGHVSVLVTLSNPSGLQFILEGTGVRTEGKFEEF